MAPPLALARSPASALAASQLVRPLRLRIPSTTTVSFPAVRLPLLIRCQASQASAAQATSEADASAQSQGGHVQQHQHVAKAGAQQEQGQGQGQGMQLQHQQHQQHQQQLQGQPRTRDLSTSPAFSDSLGPWFPADRTLRRMLTTMDRMFDDVMGVTAGPTLPLMRPSWALPTTPASPLASALRAPWDVQETEEAYHLRFDLPGMDKEEVEVNVSREGVLSIRAQHKEETKEGDLWRRRLSSNYQTSVQLPEDTAKEGIQAEMKNGVLTVTVPKQQQEQRQAMKITVA